MKKLLPYLSALICSIGYFYAHGQDKLQEFGKIDIADLQMKECPFEKGADAMNLINTETISFSVDGFTGTPKITKEYWVRIKIFSESGFRNASIGIPYSTKSHSVKITDIEAFIYNLDSAGNIVTEKVDKNQVFKEKSRSGKSHNDVRFTFPNLKKGSVIEYRYTRTDKDDVYLHPWLFQDELPSRFTKCTVTMPAYMNLTYHFVATQPVEKDSSEKKYYRTENNETTRSFAMRNVPAFKQEPFMTSLKDNLQRVEFAVTPRNYVLSGSTNTRWSLYNSMLLTARFFGLQFNEPVDSTGVFIDSVKTLKQIPGRIRAVYSFVKKKVIWNGEQSFYPADVDECWKDKSGSSAEMNILLVNLLRKAGVQCFPILISTRENGKLDESFPSLGQFDGVDVLAVDSNQVYVLDCTQKNLSYTTTPFDILNRQAFIVDNDNSKWININDNRLLMNTALSVNAKLDSTGVLKGSGEMIYTGIAKAETIKEQEKEEKEKQSSKDMVDNDAPDLKIDSVTAVHENDDNDTLLHKITFHCELSNTGDIYFINPFMFSMFKKNPFTDTARFANIDFGSNQSFATKIFISIPDNFSIEDRPRSVLIRTEDSSVMFKREILSSGNQVLIRNTFTINRPLFDKDEYSTLKSFFDKVYGLINEQIVLKKNG